MRHFLSFISIILLFSCNSDDDNINIQNVDDTNEEETIIEISGTARNFLFEVTEIMQNNSINKNEIDWDEFELNVYNKVEGAQTITDTYPGIREALRMLGDNHSSFRGIDGTFIFEGTLNCSSAPFKTPETPSNIGYVKVNSFDGSSNNEAAIAFANEIQNQIIAQDNNTITGWIVDLRDNGGGNMWPMLAGIGPILGNGTAGYFIDPDGNQSEWGYLNGRSILNNNTLTQLASFHQLINKKAKVAILYNNSIASSGEAIVVAFRGKENTRSFGSSTCGLSTANRGYTLSDGSFLNLTTSTFADRNQVLYGGSILPDEEATSDTIIDAAINYLKQ